MRAIGGTRHGEWIDVDRNSFGAFRSPVVFPVPLALKRFVEGPIDPHEELAPSGEVYEVRRMIWPGFRFAIHILLGPGVRIPAQPVAYDSSWPNPLVGPVCRCDQPGIMPHWMGVPPSACHLDHCPVHGQWTFPPITPMGVSVEAREAWLKYEQQNADAREIEAGADPAALWNNFMGRT